MPVLRSIPQIVLHDFRLRDTGPWWARPTSFVGWQYRIALFLLICLAIVWTARRLGIVLSILVGLIALGITVLVIWLRYRDDEL